MTFFSFFFFVCNRINDVNCRLLKKDLMSIIKDAGRLLRKEPNMLKVDAPVTGKKNLLEICFCCFFFII
jgi:hypothetical protein